MYRIDGKYLRFSGVNNPAQNDPSSVTEPGAGFINLAINDPDGENLDEHGSVLSGDVRFSRSCRPRFSRSIPIRPKTT